MKKPCWFPFYPDDFLGSNKVSLMTIEEIGAYFLLLCREWTDPRCLLPNDEEKLQKLARFSGNFTNIRACFIEKDGSLINERLYAEWKKSQKIRRLKRKAGVIGMRNRWHNTSITDAITQTITKHNQSQSQSQSQEEKREETTLSGSGPNGRNYRAEAKTVLQFLNEKTGKHYREVPANLRFIEARLKSGVDVQTCKSLIARKVRDWTPKPEMLPYLRPETLFNQTKFETYLAEVTQ